MSLTATPSYKRVVSEMLALVDATGLVHAAKFGVLCGGLMGSLSDGDLATSATWAREFARQLSTLGPGHRSFYYKFVVRLALARRDYGQAAAYRAEMVSCACAGGWQLDEATALLLSAEVFHHRGAHESARSDLERAGDIAGSMFSPYMDFMYYLAEAYLHLTNGDDQGGLRTLQSTMSLGKTGGFFNTPIWQPDSMAYLAARALDAGIEVDYVRD
jgi:hypothetical protein